MRKLMHVINHYGHIAYLGSVATVTSPNKVYGIIAGILTVTGIVSALMREDD